MYTRYVHIYIPGVYVYSRIYEIFSLCPEYNTLFLVLAYRFVVVVVFSFCMLPPLIYDGHNKQAGDQYHHGLCTMIDCFVFFYGDIIIIISQSLPSPLSLKTKITNNTLLQLRRLVTTNPKSLSRRFVSSTRPQMFTYLQLP